MDVIYKGCRGHVGIIGLELFSRVSTPSPALFDVDLF